MPVKLTPSVDLQIFLFPAKSAHRLQLRRLSPFALLPIVLVAFQQPAFSQEANAVIQESAIESHDIVPSEEERAAAAAQEPFKEPAQREPASVTVTPTMSDEEKLEAPAPGEAATPKEQSEPAVEMPEVKLMKVTKTPSTTVDSETALKWLKNGNVRFTHNRIRKDGQAASDRARVAKGEHPHAVVLACSDSRTPPEILFDQKLGEIFVVRTLGETAGPSAIASIEYAIEKLGIKLIVVLGHERCEAVQAALEIKSEAKEETKSEEPASAWEKVVSEVRGHLPPQPDSGLSENLAREGMANAQGVAKDLAARSEIIKKHLEVGDLKIQSAIYHLNSGEVEFK